LVGRELPYREFDEIGKIVMGSADHQGKSCCAPAQAESPSDPIAKIARIAAVRRVPDSMPSWPEHVRGTPNALLRSALFGAVQGSKRATYKKRTLLASVKGIEVRFLGVQLDQSDLDLWMEIVHLARTQIPGFPITFSASGMLKALQRCTGKNDHEWLKEAMARLGGAFVEITVKGHHTFGNNGFLRFYRDEATKRYVVELSQPMLQLFADGYSYVDLRQRKKLRRKPLALWLHGYLCSHKEPLPIKIETLRQLSGSADKSLSSFSQRLKGALAVLVKASVIERFEVTEEGLVRFYKTGLD
jgi:hypothetical protein